MPNDSPDSTPAQSATAATPDTTGAAKTADTIRAALRNKANGAAVRSGKNPYGADQKPPPAPYGTRRSMGKR